MNLNRRSDTDDLEMPLYPARTFLAHVALRSIQMGSTIGLVASPLVALVYRRSLGRAVSSSVTRSSLGFFIVMMGYMATQTYLGKFDEMSVDDRAYRLAHNEGQLKSDELAYQAAAAGLIYSTLRGRVTPGALISAPLTGIALSVIGFGGYSLLQSPKGKKITDKIIKEITPYLKSAQ